MSKLQRYLGVVFSGLLLSAAWPGIGGLTFLVFIAFLPFLLVEDYVYRKNLRPRKVYALAFVLFLVFNTSTTWWIYFASAGGVVMAVIANSLLMAIPFWLAHLTKRFVGRKEGNLSLPIYWIGFEWCHHQWELSWPWLTLGNVFANQPDAVQWYEYTGVLGGSLWILAVNLILFRIAKNIYVSRQEWKKQFVTGVVWLLFILLPLALSSFLKKPVKGGAFKEVVIVQPNIDPYEEKFSGALSPEDQIKRIISLAKSELTENTALLIAPETAIPFSLDEGAFERFQVVVDLRKITEDFPTLRVISGASTHRYFSTDKRPSYAAEPLANGKGFVEYYNTAVHFQSQSDSFTFYRKNKLVLGVEKIPFSEMLPFLGDLALDMGGTSGNLGFDPEPVVFESSLYHQDLKVAPVICYESVYGQYVSDYVKKGANLIAIITNDGWWSDTPGYKQHLAYARLRAIETRRCIVRSANTGISAIINEWGGIEKKTKWWEPTVIKGNVRINNELTFYTRHGDFIGRTFLFIAVLLLFYLVVKYIKR